MAAILSDIFDGSDRNFIYMLSLSECQQRNNEEHLKTHKTPNEITVCLQTLGSRDYRCWDRTFFDPKK